MATSMSSDERKKSFFRSLIQQWKSNGNIPASTEARYTLLTEGEFSSVRVALQRGLSASLALALEVKRTAACVAIQTALGTKSHRVEVLRSAINLTGTIAKENEA